MATLKQWISARGEEDAVRELIYRGRLSRNTVISAADDGCKTTRVAVAIFDAIRDFEAGRPESDRIGVALTELLVPGAE